TCLKLDLHSASAAEVALFKACGALGCRAPCASVLSGFEVIRLATAFGRPHQAHALKESLQLLGDQSLDGQLLGKQHRGDETMSPEAVRFLRGVIVIRPSPFHFVACVMYLRPLMFILPSPLCLR